MDSETDPCPNCGQLALTVFYDEDTGITHCVKCGNCGYQRGRLLVAV
jgi:Zn ribbon nucleic-acid-binding protein